jgi:hypothetical protein
MQKLSRRDWLKQAALGLAGLSLFPAEALGDSVPSNKQSKTLADDTTMEVFRPSTPVDQWLEFMDGRRVYVHPGNKYEVTTADGLLVGYVTAVADE